MDLKSFITGLFVGAAALLLVGAGRPSGESGRYRIVATQQYAFVLDTQTGRVWTANVSLPGNAKGTDADFYQAKEP